MAITIERADGFLYTVDEAVSFNIDAEGRLLVFGGESGTEVVVIYEKGAWIAAEREPEEEE